MFIFQLSRFYIPYSIMYPALFVAESIIKHVQPISSLDLATPLCSVTYICQSYYFNSDKARKDLGYTPIYTPEEAQKNSLKYYKNLVL